MISNLLLREKKRKKKQIENINNCVQCTLLDNKQNVVIVSVERHK